MTTKKYSIEKIQNFFTNPELSKYNVLSITERKLIYAFCKKSLENNSGNVEKAKTIIELINKATIKLRDYQQAITNFMTDDPTNKEHNDTLLVIHGTGCGKTVTGIQVLKNFLKQYPKRKVIIACPAKVINHWKNTLNKMNVPPKLLTTEKQRKQQKYNKISILSHANYKTALEDGKENICYKNLVILDEVHNLKKSRDTKNKDTKEIIWKGGKGYDRTMRCVKKAKKLLLLSATPFMNSLKDFEAYIDYLYKSDVDIPVNDLYSGRLIEMTEEELEKDLNTISPYLRDKIHYINCKEFIPERFPKYTEQYQTINMTDDFFATYEEVVSGTIELFKKPEKFYMGYRMAVNSLKDHEDADITTMKVRRTLKIWKKLLAEKSNNRKECKSVIYTTWLQFGVDEIKNELEKDIQRSNKKIRYGIISGNETKNQVEKNIKDYNADKLDLLIVTKAGGEGIDLKGTRNIFVLEPVWNPASLDQIIGRGIRLDSHAHLPEEQRIVDIHYMLLIRPKSQCCSNDLIDGERNWLGKYCVDEETGQIRENPNFSKGHAESGDVILYQNYIFPKRKIFNILIEKFKELSIS